MPANDAAFFYFQKVITLRVIYRCTCYTRDVPAEWGTGCQWVARQISLVRKHYPVVILAYLSCKSSLIYWSDNNKHLLVRRKY